MKFSKVLFIIYCSVILNSLLLFVFGEKGCIEYEALARYKNALESNVKNVIEKNRSLNQMLTYTGTSKEQIKILAREIGYYKNDEKVIVLDGYSPPKSFYEIGNFINGTIEPKERNSILRIIVICITVSAIVCYWVISQRKKNGTQRS